MSACTRPSLLTRRQAMGAIGAMGGALAAAGLAGSGRARAAAGPRVPSRGFNLPGWVDRADGAAPSRPALAALRGLGFRTVRLPVDGNRLAAGDAEARAAMAGIRAAAGMLVDEDFDVIVDLHPSGAFASALSDTPGEGARLAVAAWTRLRDVVADLPAERVYPELMNEPPLEHARWLALRERLAGEIRARCPDHTIVWGPARYQGLWEIVRTSPLADPNAVAAVHYYSPMAFTHQCETWMPSPLERLSHLPFPATAHAPGIEAARERLRQKGDDEALAYLDDAFDGPWSKNAVRDEFDKVGRWSRAHGCPVVLDEFGVLGFCVDAASRAGWIAAVRSAAEDNGFGWVYWELDQGFGFMESRKRAGGFDMTMVDAMMGRAP